MTKRERIDFWEKMTALYQHVGRDCQLHAGRGRKQRAVIADAQRDMLCTLRRAGEILRDQIEFGQHFAIVPNDAACTLCDVEVIGRAEAVTLLSISASDYVPAFPEFYSAYEE